MKKNENIRIWGQKVILIPYDGCHVPKYHDWMKSEELQILTASEPLSLEEEYEMQQSWRDDENKCTFIILDVDVNRSSNGDEISAMIGDVNLFFNDQDSPNTAEVEIMIAEPWARGKGRGREALNSMFRYGIEALGIKMYTAKIGLTNETSLKMFSRMGFTEVSRSEVFNEVTLELHVTKTGSDAIKAQIPAYRIEKFR